MEQAETAEEEIIFIPGEHITINTYEAECTSPTCNERIEFDTTLPTGWNLKEIKISITCPKCIGTKPTRTRTRTRRGQEARPRGHRRRDLLLHTNGSLTNPQLINSIEEFLPWDSEEGLENAIADIAKAVNTPSEPTPEPELKPMRQAVDRQIANDIAINLSTWESQSEEEEVKEIEEITNLNYPPNQEPQRPIPKSEEEVQPSRIRKRRRAVSLVAEQQEKEIHPTTINCRFCEARQLETIEICTNCARHVGTGKLPGEAEKEKENDEEPPEIDLSSRTIKKMKKSDTIDACRSLGLSTDGNVKDLKTRLTAYRNSQEE